MGGAVTTGVSTDVHDALADRCRSYGCGIQSTGRLGCTTVLIVRGSGVDSELVVRMHRRCGVEQLVNCEAEVRVSGIIDYPSHF